jgi:pyruvate/2-oxoglutarate dehydrogenase complex dihydrolipoamide dehydrogenase (E3) component
VAVNRSELAADQIFINVCARAAIPPIPGLDRVPYLTNSSMMDIDFLPPHLVILGGSYVRLEFAQMSLTKNWIRNKKRRQERTSQGAAADTLTER